MSTLGYALLVDMHDFDGARGPVEDGIYLFPTKDEALDFAVKNLKATGYLLSDECEVLCEDEEAEVSNEEWMEAYQRTLRKLSYYHIRVVKSAGNQEMITWHDASESLPDDYASVLLIDAASESQCGFRCKGGFADFNGDDLRQDVTHWADLPAGPEVAS